MVSGNFWIYPDRIAKGWDASLAHLPYHFLRREMISYLDRNQIPVETVGSEVPNLYPFDEIDAGNDKRSFPRANLSQNTYIFYSNIFNGFTDREIDILKSSWEIETEYHCLQVEVVLYRNPELIH